MLVRTILSDKMPEVPTVWEYVVLCVSQLNFITPLEIKLHLIDFKSDRLLETLCIYYDKKLFKIIAL